MFRLVPGFFNSVQFREIKNYQLEKVNDINILITITKFSLENHETGLNQSCSGFKYDAVDEWVVFFQLCSILK